MKAAERQLRIRQMLETRDFVDLETLCRELETSESSIRRDLDILELAQVLRRVYGGAVSLVQTGVESHAATAPALAVGASEAAAISGPASALAVVADQVPFADEKRRIAQLTATLIRDGQTVILDGGSTVLAVAEELATKSIHVITNSLAIAELLETRRNIELTLTGGYLEARHRVLLGPFCEQMLSAIRADVAIMGIGGISEVGFSNNNTLVVGSEQKMISVAAKTIIVADHTKFGRAGMIPVAALAAASVVVTDCTTCEEHIDLLRSHGVDVLTA